MTLSVSIRHTLPAFTLDATFESDGRLTALFGPSGCGKTTVVNVIAGLVRPASARIECDGHILAHTENAIWLPPHQRRIGYVFQDARLLPHLTVHQNLRFGRWFTPQLQRYASEDDIVDLLGLAHLLMRKPRDLSGGEKQRVAIGRALLQSPRLLLMDEPLASLDETRKQEILPYIESLSDEARVPIVYVSHALSEVTRLATNVVLMDHGHVVESGPLQRVINALSSLDDDMAKEAGSLLDAEVKNYDPATGLTTLASPAGEIRLAGQMPEGRRVLLHVRATDVTLATRKPEGLSAINILEGIVEHVRSAEGPSVTVTVHTGEGHITSRITRYSADKLDIKPGKRVHVIIKAMSVRPSA